MFLAWVEQDSKGDAMYGSKGRWDFKSLEDSVIVLEKVMDVGVEGVILSHWGEANIS